MFNNSNEHSYYIDMAKGYAASSLIYTWMYSDRVSLHMVLLDCIILAQKCLTTLSKVDNNPYQAALRISYQERA